MKLGKEKRMKTVFLILVTSLVASCAMSNDEVIAAYKKCDAAGLASHEFRATVNGHINSIQCEKAVVKEDEKS